MPVLQAELDRVLAPGYLGDLPSRPLDEIRSLREDSTQVAEKVSYLRRLVHARIDIVVGEIRRRAAGGDRADLASLVEELNDALAENVQSPGHERMVSPAPPPDVDEVTAEFDAALGHRITDLPDLSDDEVRVLADRLAEIDRDLSPKRRAVFDRVDALGQELTRRYGSGEATVDSVLR